MNGRHVCVGRLRHKLLDLEAVPVEVAVWGDQLFRLRVRHADGRVEPLCFLLDVDDSPRRLFQLFDALGDGVERSGRRNGLRVHLLERPARLGQLGTLPRHGFDRRVERTALFPSRCDQRLKLFGLLLRLAASGQALDGVQHGLSLNQRVRCREEDTRQGV